MPIKKFNGHRSRNAWNVSLWINNEPLYYKLALTCLAQCKNQVAPASQMFCNMVTEKTPDNYYFNPMSVRLALKDLVTN